MNDQNNTNTGVPASPASTMPMPEPVATSVDPMSTEPTAPVTVIPDPQPVVDAGMGQQGASTPMADTNAQQAMPQPAVGEPTMPVAGTTATETPMTQSGDAGTQGGMPPTTPPTTPTV